MNIELSNIVAEINREHALAQKASEIAVEHGLRVGELLLQVKESLPHGEFGNWLAQNVTVSERQAQRYMRHAKGLPVLRSMKSDTVSFLEHDKESITRIVAETVAQQMAIERAKMVAEFEREKELAELLNSAKAKHIEFLKNRDALIIDLVKMKALHVGAYWSQLVEIHKNKPLAELLFDDCSNDDMTENEARVMTDVVHANLVAQIEAVEILRNHKDWTELEFESFDDFVEKNSVDLDHFERYQQIPIYSEIVESIKAFKAAMEG